MAIGAVVASAVRTSQSTGRIARTGGSGSSASGSSRGGSSGAVSQSSDSRGSSSRGGGGSSASSAKAYKKEKRRRTCKTCPVWRYEMGIRKLGGVPYIYQWHYLFVVAWNRGGSGALPTYSAFPPSEGVNPGLSGVISGVSTSDSVKNVEEGHVPNPDDSEDFGYLKAHISPDYYVSGEVAPSSRFITLKDTNRNLTAKLAAESMIIDAKRIKYVPTGPNSNSFAMTIAEKSELPRRKPAGDAPGSGMRL